jgi:type I restriction enzyme M protein
MQMNNTNDQSTNTRLTTTADAPKPSDTTLAAFIWKNAEDLWGHFKHPDFGKIILPFTLLRRLECVLEPSRDAVRKAHSEFKDKGLDTDLILRQTACLPFYNTSFYSLATLGANKTKSNLEAYVAGFSDNARVIFDQFNFMDTVARLARADILFKICQNFANTDLHPDVVPDRVMSNIYEHLIRRFGAEVNEAAEDFMTPRDVVHLATTLLLDPDDALFRNNPGLIRTLYDPTCGTGGFLTDAMNHVDGYTALGKAPPVLIPFGQELEPETHAVALANMLLRRLEAEPARDLSANIAGPKSTLSQDAFAGKHFHYCLANPPFGKKWENDQAYVEREAKEKGFNGRFGAGTPRVTDGSMLFLQHLVGKLELPAKGGGRAAIILSGSPLATGIAGGHGNSETQIRRWLLENDYVDAIVALPTDIFFRTTLGTYIWLLDNDKPEVRKGKIQLIDATALHSPMRKAEGEKRRYISSEQIQTIAQIYAEFETDENARIIEIQDIGYRRIKVQRPLRLSIHITEDTLANLQSSKAFCKLDQREQESWLNLLRTYSGQSYPFSYLTVLVKAAENAGLKKIGKSLIGALELSLGVRDPDAPVVLDENGHPVADKMLEDFEIVPLGQPVSAYMATEVLPHFRDAWVDPYYTDDQDGEVGKVGYEINFNRYFFSYEHPRSLMEIDAELVLIERKIIDLIREERALNPNPSATKQGGASQEVRESGIKWVGQIPADWEVKPFYSYVKEVSTLNHGLKEKNLLSLSYGHIVRKDINGAGGLTPESYDGYNIVEPGDIVFRFTDLQNDQKSLRSGLVLERGIITSAYVTVRPNDDSSYFNYLMRSYDISKVFYGIGGGIRQSMKFGDLKRLPVITPPRSLDRKQITDYLDSETSRIGELIRHKERSIELLEERRNALITAAVTGKIDLRQQT